MSGYYSSYIALHDKISSLLIKILFRKGRGGNIEKIAIIA